MLLKVKNGEAYNIADKYSDIHLKDFARLCAEAVGTKADFDISDASEATEYSNTTLG